MNQTETRALPGTLYVVATPIGNLGDITARAVSILRSVDLVAAEDTRHTGALLRHLGIAVPLVSVHEHNEAQRAPALVKRLQAGESVALVSDAGTPLVSDPGFALVRCAREAGVAVSPLPGPCALVTALSAAGIATARFTFEGFLPATASARRSALSALAGEVRTMVFYESPHRVTACMDDLVAIFGGERRGALCRELTKRFESIVDGGLAMLAEWLAADDNHRRGEFVIVVAGVEAEAADTPRPEWVEAVRTLNQHMPLKQAAQLIAGVTGARPQALYRLAGAASAKRRR